MSKEEIKIDIVESIYITICENCRLHALGEISQDKYEKEAKRIMNDLRKVLSSQQSEAIELLKDFSALINGTRCPNCDGSGIVPRRVTRHGSRQISETEFEQYSIEDVEPEPCLWCYEKARLSELYKKFKDESK